MLLYAWIRIRILKGLSLICFSSPHFQLSLLSSVNWIFWKWYTWCLCFRLFSVTMCSSPYPTKFPPSTLRAKNLSAHSSSSINSCPLVSPLRGQKAHPQASLMSGMASGLSKLRNQFSGSFRSICFSLLLTVCEWEERIWTRAYEKNFRVASSQDCPNKHPASNWNYNCCESRHESHGLSWQPINYTTKAPSISFAKNGSWVFLDCENNVGEPQVWVAKSLQ